MTTEIEVQYKILSLEQQEQESKTINLRISKTNNMYIIHRALIKHKHEHRQGNANCKNRSQIRGGGKKPWKQKGTGKARAGSIRSPLWKGGGVIFGPKTKNHTKKLNKKESQLAVRNLLYNKKNKTIILDNLDFSYIQPKTKLFLEIIKQLEIDINKRILLIIANKYINIYLSIRNIKNIEMIEASQINISSLINAEHIIMESKALDIIQKIYNG